MGWGIQFQQAWFLIFMGLIVTLFAANLWGFFEVRLPSALASYGGEASGGNGLAGHFLTGAFATLLATPCSAPFLGTAVGFALSQGDGPRSCGCSPPSASAWRCPISRSRWFRR